MKEYLITSGFMDRQRRLILSDDYLEWEAGNLKGSEYLRLEGSKIVDFKHGTASIVWYKFIIGQQFSITVKDQENTELEIRFSSHLGLNRVNRRIYSDIVADIWRLYHSGIVDRLLESFYNRGELEIKGIKLKDAGIELGRKGKLVAWDKVETKDYPTYFVIYSSEDAEIHSTVTQNEYGTETLWSAVETVRKQKGTIHNIAHRK